MKKHILLLFLLTLFFLCIKGQTLSQIYVDPCDGKIYTISIPISDVGVLVVVRNEAKVFTSQDFRNGVVSAWIKTVFAKPCPTSQILQQTVTQSVTQTLSSSTILSTPPPPPPTAPPPPPTTPTTDAGTTTSTSTESAPQQSSETQSSSSESSSSETKQESKEEKPAESKKEEKKSESKKEQKKKEAAKNPMLIASDLTFAQNIDGKFSTIVSLGMSKSSLAGDVTYGGNAMVWSTLDQFVLGGNLTKSKFKNGKITGMNSFSATTVYISGNLVGMTGYTYIQPSEKIGTWGYNVSFVNLFTKGEQKYNYNLITSLAAFWTKPYRVNKKMVISPQVFFMGTYFSYNSVTKLATLTPSTKPSALFGFSYDYRISKRFGLSCNYKGAVSTENGVPILHNFLIGSRMVL